MRTHALDLCNNHPFHKKNNNKNFGCSGLELKKIWKKYCKKNSKFTEVFCGGSWLKLPPPVET